MDNLEPECCKACTAGEPCEKQDAAPMNKVEYRIAIHGVPPGTLWLGITKGKWPVHAFTNKQHAMDWLRYDVDGKSIFRARLEDIVEMKLVAPEPYLTEVIGGWDETL